MYTYNLIRLFNVSLTTIHIVMNFAERTSTIANIYIYKNKIHICRYFINCIFADYGAACDAQRSCIFIPLNQCVCMRALKCNKIQKYIAIKLQYINIIKCIFKRFSILIWSKISRYKRQRHVTHIVK